jgi:hypothetical protein
MGGGNAQKTAMSRAKNQAKAGSDKGSQLAANAAALSLKCKICMQPFICTSSEAKLKEHSDAKHPKQTFAECFPGYVPK